MEAERDLQAEQFIDELSQHEKDVYRFMRNEYERTMNYGDAYDAKVQDPQLTALVSREFNISAEEARTIYMEVESKVADFHREQAKER
ncbi:hypothetical protein [Domibacillus robiginosus]|uniref:hypothetical protein n=1 Tax=Domibacillus robiginosus TaxID=1071054 RepID=UPI00067AE4EB|nr:hypothetical protein [Domibacillus robiginosus]